MEFIAHRGESFDAPENTLAAYRLAWERHDKAIELDIQLTKDGALICCHDHTTDRTTGVSGRIAEMTLAEIKALDAGRLRGERWTGEKIPTLDEALATVPEGARCYIEPKGYPMPDGMVDTLKKVVEASPLRRDQFVLHSFYKDTILESKRKIPWMTAYLLEGFWGEHGKMPGSETIDPLIDAAHLCQSDGLGLAYDGPFDVDSIRKIKEAGLRFYVWTVDDVEAAVRMAEMGAEGIASNRAAWLKEQLSVRAGLTGGKIVPIEY